MTTRTSRGTKRFTAAAAAVAVIASTLAISGSAAAGPGSAAPTSERLGGELRYETAGIVADEIASVSTITVANGLNFPDGLAGAFLDQAILLTEAGSLPDDTVEWLTANNAEINNIQIVGGATVVSSAVATQLAAYGTVTRLGGANRYDTAIAIAESEAPATTEIIIARGDDFPDALASGPLAIEADAPIILNAGATLRSEVTAYLDANDQITTAYIAGGETAVPATVQAELVAQGITVERLGGANRDATAVAIANELRTLGDFEDGVILANRLRFADAMVAGPLGGERTLPILLVAETTIPQATAAYHVANCSTIAEIIAVGGPDVIDNSVIADAVAAATCGTTANQTFTVSGATEGRDLGVDGARTCIVTGLAAGGTYDAALFPSENVRVATSGAVTFADANGNSLADGEGVGVGEPGAPAVTTVVIANVNGTPTALPEINNVVAPTGVLAVTLAAGAVDDVTLVVWQDNPGFTANALDLAVPAVANNDPKTSREAFGIGCRTLFADEAAGGAFAGVAVTSTDKAANLFTAGGSNYFYDANDIFQIGGVPQPAGEAGLAAFEARLSPSDLVSGTYATDPAGVSTFNLDDAAPVAPLSVTPTVSGTTVTLSFPESTTPTADSYGIYRIVRPATVTAPNAFGCPDFNAAGSTGRGAYPASPTATVADPTPSTVGATALSFVDSGLATNTNFCYAVTTVDEGDSSSTGTETAAATSTVGSAPRISDVRARDAGTIGLLDAGDLHQFIFSEPMIATVAANGLYRVVDADGTVAEIDCAVNATCTLQAAGTFNGTAYPAGQVLRVAVGTVTPVPSFLGTVAGVQYPVTITNVNAAFDDAGGTQLDLAGSPDKAINVDTITPNP